MRNWTDQQFKDAGWLWVLRYEGVAMACSISPFDAKTWEKDKIGIVTSLANI